jgi:CcmD family protein
MRSNRWVLVLRASLVTLLLLVAGRVAVIAQGDGFVKFQGVPQDTMPASPMVLAAYGFVWAALLVYVFLLWQRIGRVEHELADVNAKLSARKRA